MIIIQGNEQVLVNSIENRKEELGMLLKRTLKHKIEIYSVLLGIGKIPRTAVVADIHI